MVQEQLDVSEERVRGKGKGGAGSRLERMKGVFFSERKRNKYRNCCQLNLMR
jgi:hypothetical protein